MDTPPLPRLNLADVLKLRNRIADEAAFPYYNDLMAGGPYLGFADAVAALLRPRGVDPDVARRTCALVMGSELTRARAVAFAGAVAGNLDRLKAGEAVGPFRGFDRPAWVPFLVTAALVTRNRHGAAGCDFTFRALAGVFCPGVLVKFWGRKLYTFLAPEVGFARFPRPGAPRLEHPGQFVGLQLYGLADPLLARDGVPGFRKVAAGAAMLAYNATVLKRRCRAGPAHQCPFGYNGGAFVPCHRCGMGYRGEDGVTGCKGACHARMYETGPCDACGRADAAFDPDVSDALCLACVVKKRMTPKE